MKTFKINSNHCVYVDDYKQGQLEEVRNYVMDATIKANSVSEAIVKYFEDVLCFNFKPRYANIEENICFYNTLVDENDMEAVENEMALWKKGIIELYSNLTEVRVHELIRSEITFETENEIVLRNNKEKVKQLLLDYSKNHIDEFGSMPSDMIFNEGEKEEFVIKLEEFEEFLTVDDLNILRNKMGTIKRETGFYYQLVKEDMIFVQCSKEDIDNEIEKVNQEIEKMEGHSYGFFHSFNGERLNELDEKILEKMSLVAYEMINDTTEPDFDWILDSINYSDALLYAKHFARRENHRLLKDFESLLI